MYPPEIGGKMPEKRKKGQHLTWENRQEIQLGLKNHLSFAAIADVIGCSPDTISKEIRKHRYFKERTKTAGNYNRVNDCKYKDTCKKRNLCNKTRHHMFAMHVRNLPHADMTNICIMLIVHITSILKH